MWQQRSVYISKPLILSLEPREIAYVLTYAPYGSRPYYRGYYEQVADTGLGETALRRARKGLEQRGLLRRLTDGAWQLKLPRGGIFTRVPKEAISLLKDTPYALKLYVYLLLCSGQLNCAYPSLRRTKRDTGMSIHAILDNLQLLIDRGILDKHKRKYKKTEAFRNNCYLIRKDGGSIESRRKLLQLARQRKQRRGKTPKSIVPNQSSLNTPKESPGHGSDIFRPPRLA